ncbi:hypothetical protein NDU88_008161 [Pleurodeles waltl]|uniref:Uncharacterized protein n=1 Tax=Pleurodeles waltl TaxID=8319 RepID=A0AAV7QNX1_PLEWA|nr:hypothetical protein NDU88_008161 [Pleurodeles waltl]
MDLRPAAGTQAAASSDGPARDSETRLPESCVKRRASPCPRCRDHHRRRRRAADTSPAYPRKQWPLSPGLGGSRGRGHRSVTRNRGEARRWRRAFFLLGPRGRRVLLGSPAAPTASPPNLALHPWPRGARHSGDLQGGERKGNKTK